MAYRKWDVIVDDHPYTVELKVLGSQRTILVDGVEQIQEKKVVNLSSVDRFKLGNLGGQIEIDRSFSGVSYTLQLDRRDENGQVSQVSISYPQTEGITCEKDPAGMTLVYENVAVKTSALLYAAGLIVFGILLWTGVLRSFFPLESPLLGIFLILAGLGIGANQYLKGINRSIIRVQRNELYMHTKPVPLPWTRKNLDPADLAQLILRREIHVHSDSKGNQESKETLYKLVAETKSGNRKTLISHLEQLDDAVYLAQQIGNVLDLAISREGDWS